MPSHRSNSSPFRPRGWKGFFVEDYCRERWGWKKSRAYQMIEAAETVENLKTSTTVESPSNESQARPLAKLPAEQQPVAREKRPLDAAPAAGVGVGTVR